MKRVSEPRLGHSRSSSSRMTRRCKTFGVEGHRLRSAFALDFNLHEIALTPPKLI